MRIGIVRIWVLSLMIVLVSSCRNKEIPAYDVDFLFLEPSEGDLYTSGDELHMEIDIQGTQPISHIEVLALNITTGDTIEAYTVSTVEQFFTFHEHIILAIGVASECKVVASAWASDYAERVSREVNFTVNP